MAIVNHQTREVVFKIVYCGTPLGGKTTNLAHIHSRIDRSQRGDLVSLATSSDRTLYFDFLPIHASLINGYQTRFQLYTVPGQVYYNATRQLVLKGADGIVFVADSQVERMEENVESFQTMLANLVDNGTNPARLPFVLQFNKRDLPDAAPAEYLHYLLNNGTSIPPVHAFESVATTGHNVFATLNAVSQLVLHRFHEAMTRRSGAAPSAAPPQAGGHPGARINQPGSPQGSGPDSAPALAG